jgi:hypothetical protein
MARAATAFGILLGLGLASGLQVLDSEDPEGSPSAFEAKVDDPKMWTATGPAAGDPKLQGLFGKRFQIHRPGDFTLMKVPNAKKKHGSLLEVEAEVKEMEIGDPCLLFIKKITVSGSWLGGDSLKVHAPGVGADFALRVDQKKREGVWRPFKNMTGWEEVLHKDEGSGMITSVKGVIGRREGHAEDIKGPFEHRFLIRVAKEDQKDKRMTVDISLPKPGRQFLCVKVEHARGLGSEYNKNIEGLLGLESRELEHPALAVRDECKDSTTSTKVAERLALSGGLSRASVHWE